jgi:hypothetical protein
MRKWFSAAIIPLCLVVAFVPSTVAQAGSKSPIEISPIIAVFDQPKYETGYHTLIKVDSPAAIIDLKVTWSLKLELVDKVGAPDPAMTASGMSSGADVDPGCNNHGVLGHTGIVKLGPRAATKYATNWYFYWHHPDATNSDPVGYYHCNHALQGPHGHQGLITVVVSDGTWDCSATFKGTYSSLVAPPGEENPNVKNGTASEPECFKI